VFIIGQHDVDVGERCPIEDGDIALHAEQFTRVFEDDAVVNRIITEETDVGIAHAPDAAGDRRAAHTFDSAGLLNRCMNLITGVESEEDITARTCVLHGPAYGQMFKGIASARC